MDRTIQLGVQHATRGPRVGDPCSKLRLKCDGTRAETRLRLSTKRTSPFKSGRASVLSTTGRRAVYISPQSLYCSCKPVFCSHVTLTGYPLHFIVSFTSLPVRHRVPSHFNWTLQIPGARSPLPLNSAQWPLIVVGTQYETFFITLFYLTQAQRCAKIYLNIKADYNQL